MYVSGFTAVLFQIQVVVCS